MSGASQSNYTTYERMLAYTFDGQAIKVYVDGALDESGNYNPFLYDGSIYDGGEDGAPQRTTGFSRRR